MSAKTWIKGEGGLYSKTPTRSPMAGKLVFFGRVWVRGEGKFRHFFLGTALKQAKRKLAAYYSDPEKAVAEREAAHAARRQERSAAYKVAQLFDAFTAGYRSRGRTGFHGTILDAARAFMGDRPASSVTRALLDAYVKERESVQRKDGGGRRVSDSTIRKELIGIGTAYKWGKAQGLVPVNPADAESMPRLKETFDPQAIRWLTDDELKGLRDVSAPWLRNAIGWATETGMDKGKVLRLRWSELDLDRADGRIGAGRFAMQRDKTGKPIRQELSDGAVEVLNRAAKVRHASGVVFLDADAQPIEEKVLDWALSCAYKAAGIAGCNCRTFRHTFATRALRRRIPREVVAKMMGHSTAFITDRYMHVADDQLKAAAKAMSGPERLGSDDQESADRDSIADDSGVGSVTVPPTVLPTASREAVVR